MKIFTNGTEEYGLLLRRVIKTLEDSLETDKFANEEKTRVITLLEFIKLYGTANSIDKRALQMIMRTSFQRKSETR